MFFPYFYKNPEKFLIKNLEDQGLDTKIRITLDTPEDFELIKSIYAKFADKDFITIEDVVIFNRNA
jgi:spore coat polysaccharide biosynthesis protein SpsF (cytidylyltransferase family)